jgi:CheY-like chemotaxis protein
MITRNPKNILLADDSAFFRIKLSTILIEAGHRVTFASDGREVIKRLKVDPGGIDLLILDLQMPHIDGFRVIEWMRDNGYIGRFPTLAVTGSYEPGEVAGRLRTLGASGLVTKDFTPEQVIHCINRILFPEKADVRVQPRAPVSVMVDYTVEDETYTWSLLNISSTGVFLRTRMDLLRGSKVGQVKPEKISATS